MQAIQLFVILFTTFLTACAQLFLKLGMNSAVNNNLLVSINLEVLLRVLFSPLVFLGITIYAASTLGWLWVLSKVDLSTAYPFVSLSFIFTLIFGVFILKEPVTVNKIIGTGFIMLGCVFISR